MKYLFLCLIYGTMSFFSISEFIGNGTYLLGFPRAMSLVILIMILTVTGTVYSFIKYIDDLDRKINKLEKIKEENTNGSKSY